MLRQGIVKIFSVLRDFFIIMLITLALFEAVLQVTALFMGSKRPEGIGLVPGDIRIVALGDSNTYGLNLPVDEAYPKQLENYWNKLYKKKVQVLNLGYPGTNSSQLRRNLSNVLDRFHPHIVLMTVGVNDFWTDPFLSTVKDSASFWSFFRQLRLYKLYYMLTRIEFNQSLVNDNQGFRKFNGNDKNQSHALLKEMAQERGIKGGLNYPGLKFKINLGIHHSNLSKDDIVARLTENIRYMNTLIHDRGAVLWLTTYVSSKTYGPANEAIRKVATERGLRLIDVEKKIEEQCQTENSCNDYLFPDEHPTAKGYSAVAEIIANELGASLISVDPEIE